jgi:hypothetical protein
VLHFGILGKAKTTTFSGKNLKKFNFITWKQNIFSKSRDLRLIHDWKPKTYYAFLL